MARRPRRNHSLALKAKVAVAAIKGESEGDRGPGWAAYVGLKVADVGPRAVQTPPLRPEIAFDPGGRYPDIGTESARGLIVTQSGFKMTGTAFYLGNVG